MQHRHPVSYLQLALPCLIYVCRCPLEVCCVRSHYFYASIIMTIWLIKQHFHTLDSVHMLLFAASLWQWNAAASCHAQASLETNTTCRQVFTQYSYRLCWHGRSPLCHVSCNCCGSGSDTQRAVEMQSWNTQWVHIVPDIDLCKLRLIGNAWCKPGALNKTSSMCVTWIHLIPLTRLSSAVSFHLRTVSIRLAVQDCIGKHPGSWKAFIQLLK